MTNLPPHQVLRDRMGARQQTLRGVVHASKEFSDADPRTFAELTKGLLWNALQPGYITPSKPSAAFFNTLIMVLWDGDWRTFDQDTHFAAPHTLRTDDRDIREPGATVPRFQEGLVPLLQRQPRVRPSCPGIDFVLHIDSAALAPWVAPGTELQCHRLPEISLEGVDTRNRAVIIRKAGGSSSPLGTWARACTYGMGAATHPRTGPASWAWPSGCAPWLRQTWRTRSVTRTQNPRGAAPPMRPKSR